MTTQAELDAEYEKGKAAYLRAITAQGLMHKPRRVSHSVNPHPQDSLKHEAWQRGYNLDTNRLMAPPG